MARIDTDQQRTIPSDTALLRAVERALTGHTTRQYVADILTSLEAMLRREVSADEFDRSVAAARNRVDERNRRASGRLIRNYLTMLATLREGLLHPDGLARWEAYVMLWDSE